MDDDDKETMHDVLDRLDDLIGRVRDLEHLTRRHDVDMDDIERKITDLQSDVRQLERDK